MNNEMNVPEGVKRYRAVVVDLGDGPVPSITADPNADLIHVSDLHLIRSEEQAKVGDALDLAERRGYERGRSQEYQRVRRALDEQAAEYRREANEARQRGEQGGWEKLTAAGDVVEAVTRIIFDSDPEQPALSGSVEQCERCEGRGWLDGDRIVSSLTCPNCGGTGKKGPSNA